VTTTKTTNQKVPTHIAEPLTNIFTHRQKQTDKQTDRQTYRQHWSAYPVQWRSLRPCHVWCLQYCLQ